eukprot:3397647-Amphidinium_carterae.1
MNGQFSKHRSSQAHICVLKHAATQEILLDAEPAQATLAADSGPLLFAPESLTTPELSSLHVLHTESTMLWVFRPVDASLRTLSLPQYKQHAALMAELSSGSVSPSVDCEDTQEFLQVLMDAQCVDWDQGVYDLTRKGKGLLTLTVLAKGCGHLGALRPGIDLEGRTRHELASMLVTLGWRSRTITSRERRRRAIALPYSCREDEEMAQKLFYVPRNALPFREYLLCLMLCRPNERLETVTIPHLQTKGYYEALLQGVDPLLRAIESQRRRKNTGPLDLLQAALPPRPRFASLLHFASPLLSASLPKNHGFVGKNTTI